VMNGGVFFLSLGMPLSRPCREAQERAQGAPGVGGAEREAVLRRVGSNRTGDRNRNRAELRRITGPWLALAIGRSHALAESSRTYKLIRGVDGKRAAVRPFGRSVCMRIRLQT
jgi:hypothetical protein